MRTSSKRAAKSFLGGLEPLESRLFLSVSQDANGWTVVTPSADTHTIYVSATGNDSADGLSAATPVKSFTKAASLVRSGFPDWVLLHRGDVFNDSFSNWSKSGRSADEPMLISTYGTGARPLIKTGTASSGFATISNSSANVNFVDVIGLQFYANLRDPSVPGSYNQNAAGGTTGFQFYANGGNLLIEDCQISFFRNNLDIEGVNGSAVQNVVLRRNVITDSWSFTSHSQGIYSYNVNNISLFQNVFDHNGWQASGAGESGFNHNIYFSFNVVGTDIEQNVISNGSYAGIMARGGGKIINNLLMQNAIAVSFGQADGANSTIGGVSGQLTGNVIIGDKGLGTTHMGQGFDIGNTKPGANVSVSNNIFTQDTQQAKPAIQLAMATGTSNPSQAVGENDVTIQNNITNGWWEGMKIDGRFVPGGTGLYGFNNVSINNNDFINSSNRLFRQDGVFSPVQEHLNGNRYYTQYLTQPNWFLLLNNTLSYTQWASAFETNAQALGAPPYADPNRSAASYDATVGGPGTVADFVAQARLLSDSSYQPTYMAQAVIDYVRTGFTLDTAAPTATAALSNPGASVSGGSTYSFAVTYRDDFFLNKTSLNSSDILVTGPNGFAQFATYISAAASTTGAGGYQSTVVTYRINAPGGAWSSGADGGYVVSLRSEQVSDTTGNMAAAATLGSFNVDLTPPAAAASATNMDSSALGTGGYTFSVTFNDASGINLTTLNGSDFEVTGPNGFDQFASLVGTTGSGSSVTATYSIAAPGGAWTSDAAGSYTIIASSNAIYDTYGNVLAGGTIATFNAAFGGESNSAATGSISGTVYNDANGNGIFDARELPLVGVVVFADLNLNGVLDENEPSAITDVNGIYTLVGLADGRYSVMEQVPSGYQMSSPSGGVISATVAGGLAVTGDNFANQVSPIITGGGGGLLGGGTGGTDGSGGTGGDPKPRTLPIRRIASRPPTL